MKRNGLESCMPVAMVTRKQLLTWSWKPGTISTSFSLVQVSFWVLRLIVVKRLKRDELKFTVRYSKFVKFLVKILTTLSTLPIISSLYHTNKTKSPYTRFYTCEIFILKYKLTRRLFCFCFQRVG